jgi:hypothetical protein
MAMWTHDPSRILNNLGQRFFVGEDCNSNRCRRDPPRGHNSVHAFRQIGIPPSPESPISSQSNSISPKYSEPLGGCQTIKIEIEIQTDSTKRVHQRRRDS